MNLFKVLCGSLIFIVLSCSSPNTENNSEKISRSFSTSYKPPVFENDTRAEIVLELADTIYRLFEAHAKTRNIPGIAYGIVVDGELVLDSALGVIDLNLKTAASTGSCFRIASMTKSFTAMAILKLRDEGKLSLSDPVSKYIPGFSAQEYTTSDSPVIDIENLLTMTAGFPEDNPWGDRQLDETDQMLVDFVSESLALSNPPSFQYEYSNTGFALLGYIVSEVSGKPYQDYIRENILQPLGMNNTFWEFDNVPDEQLVLGYRWEDEQWKQEPMLHDGSFGSMGGLITTIEDFSKYVGFHLSAWPPRSEPDNGPIKRSTLREMHTPQFSRLFANARDINNDTCAIMSGYGYGLGISTDCHGDRWVSHGGALPGFGSNYLFFPDYGIGLMAFGNLTYTSPWPLTEIRRLLFGSGKLKPRKLPVSDILIKRQEQIVKLIQEWEPQLESEILAENFYLDKSREIRISEIKDELEKAGPVQQIGEMNPQNQLRGGFELQTENGTVSIFFTLTPEHNPRIQYLRVLFNPG